MRLKKTIALIALIVLSSTFASANSEQPRGIDLGENAFGIPVNQSTFDSKESYTISFWANIKEFNDNTGESKLINIRDVTDEWPMNSWGWMWGVINQSGDIVYTVRNGANTPPSSQLVDDSFILETNKWHYYTFVFEYKTSTLNIDLYIDGKLIYTLTSQIRTYVEDDKIIMIGGQNFTSAPLNAYIDKVQLYNKALSYAEIQTTMTVPLLNDESLKGYWNFEEGCNTNSEGFMPSDNGTIKATMYKGTFEETEIVPFTFGNGIKTEEDIKLPDVFPTEDAEWVIRYKSNMANDYLCGIEKIGDTTKFYYCPEGTFTVKYYLKGDTIINDKTYSKLYDETGSFIAGTRVEGEKVYVKPECYIQTCSYCSYSRNNDDYESRVALYDTEYPLYDFETGESCFPWIYNNCNHIDIAELCDDNRVYELTRGIGSTGMGLWFDYTLLLTGPQTLPNLESFTYKGKRFFYRPHYEEVIVINPDGIKDTNSPSDINIRVDNYSLVIEKSDNNKPLKLSLYNIKGIMVKEMKLSDEITQISLSEFPQSGVYIYHISGEKINQSGKIIVK